MEGIYDAVVIGAGVAGSSMAHALAGLGWQTALLDKDASPRHKACGEFLSPDSSRSLQALGLEGAVKALSPPRITTVRLHSEKGVSLEIPLPGAALGVSRYALDAELRRMAKEQGVRLFAGCKVSRISEAGRHGYRVDYAAREGQGSLECRTVIAAWGRRPLSGFRPLVRKRDGRAFAGIKSHYTLSNPEPALDLYFFQGGYIGMAPVEGQRLNVAALLSVPLPGQAESPMDLSRIVDQAAGHIPILKQRMEAASAIPGTHAAAFPVKHDAKPQAWNGIPCIGDAAAVIPPFCGDGMSMALRSVELCVPLADAYLRGRVSKNDWKNDYTARINRHFSGPLRWGSMLERLLTHTLIASWLLRAGTMAPETAKKLVRATRLRD